MRRALVDIAKHASRQAGVTAAWVSVDEGPCGWAVTFSIDGEVHQVNVLVGTAGGEIIKAVVEKIGICEYCG